MTSKVVSIIPARKGSKGIPRKNSREFGDQPLVSHAIETSQAVESIETIVLTTDSREISQIGEQFGADIVINRPSRLATDEVPLAPVVEHAFNELDDDYDYVLCLQPTVPLISSTTLDSGIKQGIDEGAESVIFVKDSTHHYWKKTDDGFMSVSSSRKNRQLMRPIYGEIGIFLTHRNLVTDGRRVGDDPILYRVQEREGLDIDTYADWLTGESYLNRKQLVYRVTGNAQDGTGHVYRGITIADQLFHHDVLFAVGTEDDLAIKILKESNYDFELFDNTDSFLKFIDEFSPDVVANDILDTKANYVQSLKQTGVRVVNFEDLGEGSEHADAVINALYEYSNPPKNHFYGFKYFCLRNEFRYAEKKREIPTVERIMISYGGTDQNNLTSKTLRALANLDHELSLDVVLGLGYTEDETLDTVLNDLPNNFAVEVNHEVQSMAQHMEQADLLITSNGRTLYEAGALNLPVISIAQNMREQKHPYAHVSRGILSLGSAEYVTERMIRDAVVDFIQQEDMRETMRRALSNHTISNGIERIIRILFEENHAHR